MRHNLRNELISRIFDISDPNDSSLPSPVIGPDDFFTGNEDLGSIGCNLDDHPGIAYFHKTLKNIKGKKEVQDVLIEIYEIQEEDEDAWPYSERVYIIASVSRSKVEKWVSSLRPDEISEGWPYGTPINAPEIKEGYNIYNVWWD